MSALAGIRAELAELYPRRVKDAAELDRVHAAYEKARVKLEQAQGPLNYANERIEALHTAWVALTTDPFPTDKEVAK